MPSKTLVPSTERNTAGVLPSEVIQRAATLLGDFSGTAGGAGTGGPIGGTEEGAWVLAGGDPELSLPGTDFAVPRGVEAIFQYNNLVLNDRSTVDKIIVTSIDGLDDADIRDSREENPGDDGETAYDAHYGGRTIVLNGSVRAFQLSKLRDMQLAIRAAFADLSEKPLYFNTGDAAKDHYINCRKLSKLQWTEEQKDYQFFRDFQITLRASNPRFLRYQQKSMSITVGSAYVPTVMDKHPDLYWILDSVNGVNDQTVNNNDGTAYGGMTVGGSGESPMPSSTGSSTDFDGDNDVIATTYNPWAGPVTLMGWAYRDTSTTHDYLVSAYAASSTPPTLYLQQGTNNVVWASGDGSAAITWTDAWPGNGQWVHWALVFYPTVSASLYINGSLVSTQGTTGTYGAIPGNFKIGAMGAGFHYFDGKMSHIAVFKAQLGTADISAIYNTYNRFPYQTVIANEGNFYAEPTVRFHGQLSNVELAIENQLESRTISLEDSLIISSGIYYEYDSEKRTFKDSNGNNVFSDLDINSDYLLLPPGSSYMVVPTGKSIPGSTSASIEILWRDSYI